MATGPIGLGPSKSAPEPKPSAVDFSTKKGFFFVIVEVYQRRPEFLTEEEDGLYDHWNSNTRSNYPGIEYPELLGK